MTLREAMEESLRRDGEDEEFIKNIMFELNNLATSLGGASNLDRHLPRGLEEEAIESCRTFQMTDEQFESAKKRLKQITNSN